MFIAPPGAILLVVIWLETEVHDHSTDQLRQIPHLVCSEHDRQLGQRSWASQSGMEHWHKRHLEEQTPGEAQSRKKTRKANKHAITKYNQICK